MVALANLVSITDLNHGSIGKTINQLHGTEPIVILRHNKPAAVMISPDEYERLTEQAIDYQLYLEAVERDRHDNGKRYSIEDALGADYQPADDGYEPEFE